MASAAKTKAETVAAATATAESTTAPGEAEATAEGTEGRLVVARSVVMEGRERGGRRSGRSGAVGSVEEVM
jgi:hypothetical protein